MSIIKPLVNTRTYKEEYEAAQLKGPRTTRNPCCLAPWIVQA